MELASSLAPDRLGLKELYTDKYTLDDNLFKRIIIMTSVSWTAFEIFYRSNCIYILINKWENYVPLLKTYIYIYIYMLQTLLYKKLNNCSKNTRDWFQ